MQLPFTVGLFSASVHLSSGHLCEPIFISDICPSAHEGTYLQLNVSQMLICYEINDEIYNIPKHPILRKSVALGGAQIHTSCILDECPNHLDHQHNLFPRALIQELIMQG